MTVYAKQTTVSVAKSRAEIEELLTRYGADSFATGWKGDQAVVGFTYRGRAVRFELARLAVTLEQAANGSWEQECRSRWRALLLVIKAKLDDRGAARAPLLDQAVQLAALPHPRPTHSTEPVETDSITLDQEFRAHFVLPGTGQTLHQVLLPRLPPAYEHGGTMALLPEMTS